MIYSDQTGRQITLVSPPKKIISLVPSQTELLYDLGLESKIIGVTKFCIHPDKLFRSKIRVGGTKKLNIEKIKTLNPDLIIANKEENTKEQLDELMNLFPVWISDIKNLNDALLMIKQIGELTGTEKSANNIIQTVTLKFEDLNKSINHKSSAAYLIWKNPFMVAGADTFIHDMMQRAGLENVFQHKNRYPETNIEEINNFKPEVILLSSEPFPFKEKHKAEIEKKCPGSKVLLADGEMFSWYGSRLIKAADYFLSFSQQYKN